MSNKGKNSYNPLVFGLLIGAGIGVAIGAGIGVALGAGFSQRGNQ